MSLEKFNANMKKNVSWKVKSSIGVMSGWQLYEWRVLKRMGHLARAKISPLPLGEGQGVRALRGTQDTFDVGYASA